MPLACTVAGGGASSQEALVLVAEAPAHYYLGCRDSAQVLESSGAGGWLSNCNGELQHQRDSSKTKRLPAAAEAAKRAGEERGMKRLQGRGQMEEEVLPLITRQRSPHALGGASLRVTLTKTKKKTPGKKGPAL